MMPALRRGAIPLPNAPKSVLRRDTSASFARRYGPLNNKEQLSIVDELVEEARRTGASVLTGGKPMGSGYLYPPTIIADVSDSHRIVREEQFGPVIPVLKYKTEEEAIERANSTTFGLGGSIWSRDHGRAAAMAEKMECGTVWINQ